MRILTILGTRPEIIRLSIVIGLLDEVVDHVVVHTGQNYDERLDGIFFRELGVRAPDLRLEIRGRGFGDQVGQLFGLIEPLLLEHRPDRLLLLGDTNSSLASVVARRLGIPVFHMEAGNRCFDDRVPEEVNRRIVDHCSTVLMPYTARSRENLLREGIPGDRIFVTGNPIRQVMRSFEKQIESSNVLDQLEVGEGEYFLATFHRAETVDRADRLEEVVTALVTMAQVHGRPVVCSFHPRTRSRVEAFGVDVEREGLRFVEPLGFFDFVRLEQSAFCILSDSGTVQEEACILGVPNVTIREVTERPETLECGSNILAGTDVESVRRCVEIVTRARGGWIPPREYMEERVAETVVRIVTGHRISDRSELEWREGVRQQQRL